MVDPYEPTPSPPIGFPSPTPRMDSNGIKSAALILGIAAIVVVGVLFLTGVL